MLLKNQLFSFQTSNGYEEEKILSESEKLLPKVRICGGISTLGPITHDGFPGVENQKEGVLIRF